MKTKKFRWGWLILGLLLIGISVFLYTQSQPKRSSAPPSSLAANTLKFEVTREDLSTSLEIKGKSSYTKETFIYAPFSADIDAWHVSEGAEVKRDDHLFTLNAQRLQSEILELRTTLQKIRLEAQLRQVEQAGKNAQGEEPLGLTEEERLRTLAQKERDSIQSKLERVNIETSEERLRDMEAKLQAASYAAPDEGIFLFVNQREPKAVQESQLIGKIVDLSELQLISTVGEYDIFQIQPGMPVDVRVDALKQVKLQGKVTHVSKFAKDTGGQNTGAAQFEVIVSLEAHEQLIAGLGLTGTIVTDQREGALVIPSLTVYKERDTAYVYVQDEQGAITRKEITIGMETAEKTEVLSGLMEGEFVVLQ